MECRIENIKREKQYLEEFQNHYVLVSADKANNNVIVVCKMLYLESFNAQRGQLLEQNYTEHHGDI